MSALTAMGCFGGDLIAADYSLLEARWIDRETAEAALLRRVDYVTGREIVGQKSGDYSGVLIPNVLDAQVREYCIRRDNPDLEMKDGQPRERKKYARPPGRGNLAYFAPTMPADLLARAGVPVIVTEGEFKTLALWRLANHESSEPRFVPVGLSGAWNFRGTIGKAPGPNGERRDVKGVIADVDRVFWKGRKAIIAYDADAGENNSVRIGRSQLARELRSRGATVALLEWDASTGKGIDDHLVAVGPEKVLAEIEAIDFERRDWRANLISNQDGNPRALLANAITALREAPQWAGVLAFNEFSLGTVALKALPWEEKPPSEWTDHEDRLAADWFQHHGIFVSVDVAGQAVQAVAKDRKFHPVREYLKGLKWDGSHRIEAWLAFYLGVELSEYAAAVGARWLISAVARVFNPGVKADCCLILEGAQGIRKSTALKTIAGEWFTDEIAEIGSKDAAMQTRGVWIIEIAELDSLSRPEVSKVKAFMSRTNDRFRPPYGKRLIESPRQCIFAGSVNDGVCFRDETGARRFWPVTCGRIDIEALARDRDQLWAEGVERFNEGAPWWLDEQHLVVAAEAEQQQRYVGDPWDEPIAVWLGHRESATIEGILESCLEKAKSTWTQADKNRIGRSLRTLGWERYRHRDGAELQWRFRKKAVPGVP